MSGGCSTVIVNSLSEVTVAEPLVPVALTVNVEVVFEPTEFAVPVIAPLDYIDKPPGNEPDWIA